MSEKNLKITIRKTPSKSDDSSSLSSSTENAIWEDLQQFQSGSPSAFSMGGEYSPITTTPPPVRSLADLRNMFSTLSFAAPCADCESSSFKLAQIEGENEDLKKLISELKQENRDTNDRLVEIKQELEKERRNNMRLAHKFEQDFEFHKQQIVNDCGRHIEELQEEHREHIRNIERKLNTDQRQNIFAASETKKLHAEIADLTKDKRDLTYENSLLRIRLKAKRAPKEILISGNFVTAMQQKAIPGYYELDEDICHETMEYRPAYKRRELAQGHRIWLVYNKNDRVWNFQPTKKLFSSVSLIFIRSRAVFPTLISSEAVKMASNGQTGWTKIPLDIKQSPTAVEIPIHIDDELSEDDDKVPVVLLDV